MQANIMEYDRKERLTFSDLQFSSDDLQVDLKVFAANEKENSISLPSPSFNHDFLGFFSQEWSNSTTSISLNAPGDILFCGKVIHTLKTNQTSNPKNKTDSTNNKRSIIGRNSDSFSKFSGGHGQSTSSTSQSNSLPISWRKREDNKKNGVLAQRASKLACPSKSRWQVFLFGSGRFPTKMELSDMRSRQLRRSHGGEEETIRGKRLFGLIRVLGCVGGFSDEMVKGSLGYVPYC